VAFEDVTFPRPDRVAHRAGTARRDGVLPVGAGAIHEAYHLIAIERHKPTAASGAPRIEDPRYVADQRSRDDAGEALEALRRLASLPERERTDLTLQIAGYSYKEIQARTPGRTEDVPLAVELRDGDPVSELSQVGEAATSGAAVATGV
jgi:hypothetical protein